MTTLPNPVSAKNARSTKVKSSVTEALSDLKDGASIMVGGFGLCGNAEGLIAGVVASGAGDLTLISNNAGSLGKGLATWLKAGIVRRVVCTYVGNNEDLHALMRNDAEAVTVIPLSLIHI